MVSLYIPQVNEFMNKFSAIVFLSILTLSCSSDLDFNQVNDIKIEPVIVANLASFEVPANQLVSGGVEQTFSIAASNFDVFRDTFFKDNLQRADLFFEFNNTINRAFSISAVLLDTNEIPLYTINFAIPAYTGGSNLVTFSDVFQNAKLDLLKRTAKISFNLTLLPGPILSENSTGSLKLRSSATVYLVIQ